MSDDRDSGDQRSLAGTALAGTVVAAGCFLLAVPGLLNSRVVFRDEMGYLAAAWSWIHGAGFVDPILYTYYLGDARPPVSAPLIRAPLVSLLVAIPLALGAGLRGVMLFHLVFASATAGAAVAVARRTLSLPAATAFGIALGWSLVWVRGAYHALTETTAVAVLLLALAACRTAMRSVPGAIGFAGVVLLACLARSNLVVLAPVLVLATLVEKGPRTAARSRPLWAFVVAFAFLYTGAGTLYASLVGRPPYAHYGVMSELLDLANVSNFRTQYVGGAAFASAHGAELVAAVFANLRSALGLLFLEVELLRVGFFAVPALLWGFFARGAGSEERRFACLAGMALWASVLVAWTGFDGARYLLPGAVFVWYLACGLLDWVSAYAAGRTSAGLARSAWRAAPLLLVATLWMADNTADWARLSDRQLTRYRREGTRVPSGRVAQTARAWCRHLDPGARVTSPDPWSFYFACGNPGTAVPHDLETSEWVDRFLDAQAPAFVILDRSAGLRIIARSPRLEKLDVRGPLELYRVRDADLSDRWPAPPPLSSLLP